MIDENYFISNLWITLFTLDYFFPLVFIMLLVYASMVLGVNLVLISLIDLNRNDNLHGQETFIAK